MFKYGINHHLLGLEAAAELEKATDDALEAVSSLERSSMEEQPTIPVCGYLAKVTIPADQCEQYKYPFSHGDTVFIFGEIVKMEGHCVFATRDGRVHWGYHTDDFEPLTEDEV